MASEKKTVDWVEHIREIGAKDSGLAELKIVIWPNALRYTINSILDQGASEERNLIADWMAGMEYYKQIAERIRNGEHTKGV